MTSGPDKAREVLAKRTGEAVICGIPAGLMQFSSKGKTVGAAAVAGLIYPPAMATAAIGAPCYIGITNRHFMYSPTVTLRKPIIHSLHDIVNYEFEPKGRKGELRLELSGGKKLRFSFDERRFRSDMRTAEQLVGYLDQFKQQTGFQANAVTAMPPERATPGYNEPGSAVNQSHAHISQINCPNCNMLIDAGSLFCDNCGSKIMQMQKTTTQNFCPECGSPVKSGSKFCANCGMKI